MSAVALSHEDSPERRAAVLSKAVVRAADQLKLTRSHLARVLGLSSATASRLAAGDWTLTPDSKPGELAMAFLRVYRSLSAITGSDAGAMHDWLHSHNRALDGEPAQLLTRAEGLIHVLHYLDAARGRN